MSFVVYIAIPAALRRFTDERAVVEVHAENVRKALLALGELHPKLRAKIFTSSGEIFAFVGIFLNGKNVKQLHQTSTPVKAGDTLALVPAIAGG